MFLMKSIAPETYCDTVRAAKYRAKLEKESADPDPRETEARRQRIAEMLTRLREAKHSGFDFKALLSMPPQSGQVNAPR
jgi:hypothetical protein